MIDVQPQLYPTGLRPRAGAAPVRSLVVPGQWEGGMAILRAPLHTQLAGTLPCTIARVARSTPPSVQLTAPPAIIIITQAWSAS
eukprot:scaffold85188_cov22-Phaeocystis_antarctica.AAC.1